MKWSDNQISINEREIIFNAKIYNVLETNSYFFVLIGFGFDPSTHCNVYCINKKGQLLWQIKRRNRDNGAKNMNDAYIGMAFRNGKYSLVNFYNEVVYFNPFNGKLL